MNRTRAVSLVLAAMLAAATSVGHAQDSAGRALHLVVPLTAGSAFDVLGRALASRFQERTGRQVVVENRPGANMTTAANVCKAAPPDGSMVCLFTQNLTLNPLLYERLSYDPFRDLDPVAPLAYQQHVLVASKFVPAATFAGLVDYAKANPDKLNYGSVGVGSDSHLIVEWLRIVSGGQWKHVPFNGSPQVLLAFARGDVHLLLTTAGNVLQQAASGEVKVLLVRGDRRISLLPSVPSFVEAGLPPLRARSWAGLFAPAGTVPTVLARLGQEFSAIVAEPTFQERFMTSAGMEPAPAMDPESYRKLLRADQAAWAPLVKESGVRLQ